MKRPRGRHRRCHPSNDTRDAQQALYESLRASYRRPSVLGVERQDVSVLFLALALLPFGLVGNILLLEYVLRGGLSL